MDRAGQVYCSGYGLGDSPLLRDGGKAHTLFWQATTGTLIYDDPSVFRVSAGRTECQVTSSGLLCGRSSFGAAGSVVDGSRVVGAAGAGPESDVCWLTQDGKVSCWRTDRLGGPGRMEAAFRGGTVLARAANQYTDSMCAVYNDGSLHCVGSNTQGKLGTGDALPLATETMVQPPGTVRIDCR